MSTTIVRLVTGLPTAFCRWNDADSRWKRLATLDFTGLKIYRNADRDQQIRRFRSLHGKTFAFHRPTPSFSLSLSFAYSLFSDSKLIFRLRGKLEKRTTRKCRFNPRTHEHLFKHVSFKKFAIIHLITDVFNKTTHLFVRVRIPIWKGNRNLTSNFVCSFANKISPMIFIRWKKKWSLTRSRFR